MIKLKTFVKEWKTKEPKEKVFMGLGALFLLAALVGVILPVIPQVPFAIISAFFFSKGSAKLHEWIRENKYFGQPVKNWEDHRAIKPKMKIISCVAMVGGAVIGHFKFESPWSFVLDGVFALFIVFVLTRKSNASGPKLTKESRIHKTIARA